MGISGYTHGVRRATNPLANAIQKKVQRDSFFTSSFSVEAVTVATAADEATAGLAASTEESFEGKAVVSTSLFFLPIRYPHQLLLPV